MKDMHWTDFAASGYTGQEEVVFHDSMFNDLVRFTNAVAAGSAGRWALPDRMVDADVYAYRGPVSPYGTRGAVALTPNGVKTSSSIGPSSFVGRKLRPGQEQHQMGHMLDGDVFVEDNLEVMLDTFLHGKLDVEGATHLMNTLLVDKEALFKALATFELGATFGSKDAQGNVLGHVDVICDEKHTGTADFVEGILKIAAGRTKIGTLDLKQYIQQVVSALMIGESPVAGPVPLTPTDGMMPAIDDSVGDFPDGTTGVA